MTGASEKGGVATGPSDGRPSRKNGSVRPATPVPGNSNLSASHLGPVLSREVAVFHRRAAGTVETHRTCLLSTALASFPEVVTYKE